MRTKLFFIPLLFSLLGCSNELPFDNTPMENQQDVSFIRSGLDEALSIIDAIDGGSTRSHDRKVKSIHKLNTSKTRVESLIAEWYVVNFDNNDGFAIITDADYPCKVYGVSNEGYLNLSDTIFNEGLKYVIQCLEKNPELTRYSDKPNDDFDISSQQISRSEEIVGTRLLVAPLLTKTVRNWHQEAPFNQLSPMVPNVDSTEYKQAKVGCVPLAMAMIMSHYQYPKSYYSPSTDQIYDFNWDLIRTCEYKYDVSRIVRELARTYNLNVNWGFEGTGTSPSKIPVAFKNFGYIEPGFKSFHSVVWPTLGQNNPVLIGGDYERSGHCWVVDGVTKTMQALAIGEEILIYYHYHCVWGWKGQCNGYFRIVDTVDTTNPSFRDDGSESNISYVFSNLRAIGSLSENLEYNPYNQK